MGLLQHENMLKPYPRRSLLINSGYLKVSLFLYGEQPRMCEYMSWNGVGILIRSRRKDGTFQDIVVKNSMTLGPLGVKHKQ